MNEITNKNYIEEMERNSKIFEEKMNKLNSDNYEDDHAYSNNTKMISYNTYNAYNTYNTLNNDRQYIKKNLNRNNLRKIDFSKSNPFKNQNEDNYYSLNKNEEKENNYKHNKTTKNKSLSNNIDNYNSNIIDDKKLIEEIKEKIIKKNKKCSRKIKEKENLDNQNQNNEFDLIHKRTTDTLKSQSFQIKTQDEDIIDLKMKFDSIYAQNKNMKAVIEKKNNEIENLKLALKDMKEELKLSQNKYNDFNSKQRQLQQDYDTLNKEYISVKTEKENMKLFLEEQKSNEIKLKKEVNELKKIIKKLNEELKEAEEIKIKNNILNSDRQKVKEKKIYIDKNNNEKMTLKKNLYKNKFNNNREKNNYFIEYKNMDNEDNYSEYKSNKSNNNKSRHSDTEEKIIYNNEDDYSDEDDNIYKAGIKNKNKLFNSIDNKDNQNIEMELKKEKLENELLKMPDTPRKLNDIKNKKEINDYINKIERDINYINSLLKNTDAH